MSHETPTLAARRRERTGSRYAKRLRDAGRLPAVVYGHQTAPMAVEVDAKEALTHLNHGAHLFTLEIDGSPETCLVKDLQFGYLGDNLIHIDFARVDLNEEVEVNVHIHFVGDPAKASEAGAVVRHDLNEFSVRCKANAIPEEIRVDLSLMDGETLTVSQVEFPAGVAPQHDPEDIVAGISFVKELDEGEAATVEGDAEPEVITDKPEDGGEGGGGDED